MQQITDAEKNRMRELEALLEYHSRLYYELDAPELEDAEYDRLFRELQDLEAAYPAFASPTSPTKRVGGKVAERFEKVRHAASMGSLSDVFSEEEFLAFDARVRAVVPDACYCVECKFDGLSVALEYRDGVFVRGLTRGDGVYGEDVTENLKTVRSLPLTLHGDGIPSQLVVRGEVLMPRAVFAELNRTREENGEKLFANPRNAAAGSLRQLDSRLCASRKLDIFVYNVQLCDAPLPDTHSETLTLLRGWGFPISPENRCCRTGEEAVARIRELGELRRTLPFDTDGAVIKVESFAEREELGETASVPRWAAAYKYPPEVTDTTVREIQLQVGRTGVLTPRAVLTPVRLSGSTVGFATLHNADFIAQKDVRVGDTVRLHKAGEIIPEILCVLPEKRPAGTVPFRMPAVCPSCGEAVYREEGEAATRCVNPDCPAQLERRLIHFVSRDAMGIDFLGESNIRAMIGGGLLHGVADLYTLTTESILSLGSGYGEKSASNILTAIEKSKQAGLARLLYALGIRHIGEKAGQLLANAFADMDALLAADREQLLAVDEIGSESADALLQFLHSPHTAVLLERLQAVGVSMKSKQERKGDLLAGLSVVCTGTLPTLSRSEAEALIRAHGGNPSSSVSGKTAFVVAGTAAGSKLVKAQKLGIPVLDEAAFLEKIGEKAPEKS